MEGKLGWMVREGVREGGGLVEVGAMDWEVKLVEGSSKINLAKCLDRARDAPEFTEFPLAFPC